MGLFSLFLHDILMYRILGKRPVKTCSQLNLYCELESRKVSYCFHVISHVPCSECQLNCKTGYLIIPFRNQELAILMNPHHKIQHSFHYTKSELT